MFCVYITIYKGSKLPPFYIGSTSISKIEKGYRGSPTSKEYKQIWLQEKRKNPDLFKTLIISKCNTREEASLRETYLQSKLNVDTNPLYINKAIWTGRHINYKGNHTLEMRARMSQRMKAQPRGIPRTEEVKRKISETKRKQNLVLTQEHKDKISKAHKGKVVSTETRLKLSECAKRKKGRKQTQEHIDAVRKAKIKYSWIITFTDGTSELVTDLRCWCTTRNLSHNNVHNGFTYRGKYKDLLGEKIEKRAV